MYQIKILKDPVDRQLRQELLFSVAHSYEPALSGENLEVVRSEKGKPYLVRAAASATEPVDLQFSISHSGGFWACVMGPAECGLDLQELRPCQHERLAARFFDSAEQAYVRSHGLHGFYEIWTRREALAKYTGLGFFGMGALLPVLVDGIGKAASCVIWNEKKICFQEIEAPDGFMAVWCREEERL